MRNFKLKLYFFHYYALHIMLIISILEMDDSSTLQESIWKCANCNFTDRHYYLLLKHLESTHTIFTCICPIELCFHNCVNIISLKMHIKSKHKLFAKNNLISWKIPSNMDSFSIPLTIDNDIIENNNIADNEIVLNTSEMPIDNCNHSINNSEINNNQHFSTKLAVYLSKL